MLTEKLVLGALYLDTGHRRPASTTKVGAVLSVFLSLSLQEAPLFGEALRRNGLFEEATFFDDKTHLDRIFRLDMTQSFVSYFCLGYPEKLRKLGLAKAPLAMHFRAGVACFGHSEVAFGAGHAPNISIPEVFPKWIAVVGSRNPNNADLDFAKKAVQAIFDAGYGLVSGGANGIDMYARNLALEMGVPVTEILPYGFNSCKLLSNFGAFVGCLDRDMDDAIDTLNEPIEGIGYLQQFSLLPANRGFSTLSAMMRNSLIYLMASAAIVIHPRYKQGGSWHGAVEAIRRKSCPVLVPMPPGLRNGAMETGEAGREPDFLELKNAIDAARSLISFGALEWPQNTKCPVERLLSWRGMQSKLFDHEEECEYNLINSKSAFLPHLTTNIMPASLRVSETRANICLNGSGV